MTKRFTTNGYRIYDTFHDGVHWLVNQVEAQEIVDKMNNLDSKARERSKALSKLQKENEQLKQSVNNLKDTIIKITIAYQRKYDRTIVDLVDEVHEEDITDLIKELKE